MTSVWALLVVGKLLTDHYSRASITTYCSHYNNVIMSAMASQITSLTIVYSTVYSRRRSKKTLKLRNTGLSEGNSPVADEIPAQRASYAENVSIWWRHHEWGKIAFFTDMWGNQRKDQLSLFLFWFLHNLCRNEGVKVWNLRPKSYIVLKGFACAEAARVVSI